MKNTPRWIRGDRLPPEVQQDALRRFLHRNTHENARNAVGGGTSLFDAEWLAYYAFAVTKANRLDRRVSYCQPAYLAGAL